jgi:hypothetical protein
MVYVGERDRRAGFVAARLAVGGLVVVPLVPGEP